LITEGEQRFALSDSERPIRILVMGLVNLNEAVAGGQDQVIHVLRAGVLLRREDHRRKLLNTIERARQFRWGNDFKEKCLESASESLQRARVHLAEGDLLKCVVELRYWSGAANNLGRASLLCQGVVPATHILDVYLGLKRTSHAFWASYERAQGLKGYSARDVQSYLEFLRDKRKEQSERMQFLGIESDTWHGAATEIRLLDRCLRESEVKGAVLQARYITLLLAATANKCAGYKECPYRAGIDERITRLKEADPKLHQFLNQIEDHNRCDRDTLIDLIKDLGTTTKDTS